MDTSEKIRANVKCCSCQGTLEESWYINGITLNKLATWKHPVWGNVLVDDKQPRATAIVCYKCLQENKPIKYALEWDDNLTKIIYHPVETLKDLPSITIEDIARAQKETIR